MRQAQAKEKLMKEFDEWAYEFKSSQKPTVQEAFFTFFSYISSEKPSLLDFKYPGDKWQKVKSWLIESSRITDN